MRALIFCTLLFSQVSWADEPQETFDMSEDIRFGPVCVLPENVCSDIVQVHERKDSWSVERASLPPSLISMFAPIFQGEFKKEWSEWDIAEQKLIVRPPLSFRIPTSLHKTMPMPPMVSRPLAWGSNYATHVSKDNHSLLLSPFVSKGDTVIKSSWQYTQGRWSKGLAYLEHDQRSKGVRWGLGDRAVSSRDPAGLGVIIEGFSFEKAHDLNPYSPYRARPGWQGVLLEQGVLDIYSNGSLVSTTPVTPGFYEWHNLGLSGSGHLKGVLKTPAGQQEVFSERRYGGSNLAKGVSDFSFHVGKTPIGSRLVHGYYAKGFSEWFTLGGQHAKAQGKHQTSLLVSLQPNAPVSGMMQFAHDHDQRKAYAWSISGGFQSFSVSHGQRAMDRGFWDIGDEQNLGLEEVLREKTSSLNVSGAWGSLAFSHQARRNVDWKRDELSSVTFSRSFNSWQMFATAQKSTSFEPSVFVGVTVPLGIRDTVHAQYRHTDKDVFGALYQRRAQNDGLGASYHLQAQSDGTGNASYRHGYRSGVFYADVDVNREVQPTLGWSGSVVGFRDGVHFSRPSETFLLIQAPEAQGVDVLKNNQKVAVVPSSGSVLLADIPSYSGLKIGLEQKQIALNVAQKNLEKSIQTPRHGLGVVTFDTSAPKEVQGVLKIQDQPVKFGMLVFDDGQEIFVGERGDIEFVLKEEKNPPAVFYSDTGEKWSCSLILSEDRRFVDKSECQSLNKNETPVLEKP